MEKKFVAIMSDILSFTIDREEVSYFVSYTSFFSFFQRTAFNPTYQTVKKKKNNLKVFVLSALTIFKIFLS